MKLNVIFRLLALLLIANTSKIYAQNQNALDSVEVIKEFKNFYKSGNYYFGGQPTLEAIQWLKSENVTLFVNLRSENENERFTNTAFCEKDILKEYGIEYASVPVSYPESYNPEVLTSFAEILNNHNDKIFIHCASGGRVRYFFMAYLIEYKSYSPHDAIAFCKQMDYSFPLELILGKEINISIK